MHAVSLQAVHYRGDVLMTPAEAAIRRWLALGLPLASDPFCPQDYTREATVAGRRVLFCNPITEARVRRHPAPPRVPRP